MIIEIGYFAVIIALMVSIAGILTPLIGLKTRNPAWIRAGRQAVTANFILLSLGCGTLIYSFLSHDFSVKYVAMNSNSRLPVFYTVSALWGGHEGSLLFWAWILAAFAALAAWIYWKTHPATMPYLLIIESSLTVGFLALIIFLSSPFERIFPSPAEGMDLNPLLQDPGMVFPPPFLYLGYVGFSIPFSFALAALLSGRLDEEWIRATHRWTLFSWIMLTFGILMGGYWAYYELGWGGYWAWDPVENASFMPWLVGTAFLHSVMVQEKRKMFKVWNLFLIIVTFSLSLIGTFLVRSGVLTSVHTFATDPERGLYILIFLGVVMGTAFGTLIARAQKLKSRIELDSIVSRESVFMFNNLFFLVAAATVFLGTLYPLMIETWKGSKVTVGPPYYNAVFMPIALGLLFLMGVGPYIAWRKASLDNLKKNFLIPLIAAFAVTALAFALGFRSPFTIAGAFVVGFVSTTVVADFGRVSAFFARRDRVNYVRGFLTAFAANQRRYAGLVTHIGVLILVIGIIASTVYQTEKVVSLRAGDEFTMGPYRLTLAEIRDVRGPNWTAKEGGFELYRGDRLLTEMRPQKRIYDASQTPTTESALYAINMGHVFLTMPEITPYGTATARGVINPLILWVWGGGAIMGLGVLLNIFRPRRRDE